jgi:hypothetical protein
LITGCFKKIVSFIESVLNFLPNIPLTDHSAIIMNKEGTASHLEEIGVESIKVIVDC